MKDLKGGIAKMMLGAGENIAQMIASESFELWQRKDFRFYIDFDNIGQTEQDKIFNELALSLIRLFVLRLDQTPPGLPEEKAMTFRALSVSIQEGFLKILEDSGVERKFIKQWEELIDMRLKEYREDLKLAMKESLKDKNFKGKDAYLKQIWARVETITIDCLTHIRRGKVEKKDPLLNFLKRWFITLDVRLAPIEKLSG